MDHFSWLWFLGLLPVVGMAFALLDSAIGAARFDWTTVTKSALRVTDQVVNTQTFSTGATTLSFGFAVRNVRAVIWCKSFSSGGTLSVGSGQYLGPMFRLQVADDTNSAFATNVRDIAAPVVMPRGATAFTMDGVVPDNFLALACRIQVQQATSGFSDTFTFDAQIEAA